MHSLRLACVLALTFLPLTPACAQWEIAGGAGLQHTNLTEYAPDGRELVREHGWMPGILLHAGHTRGAWRFGLGASSFRRAIAYDGSLQNGVPFATDTDAVQERLGADVVYRLSETALLIGGLEREYRLRKIQGRGAVSGLDERSVSWRLLAGGQMRLVRSATATVDAQASLVLAQAERLRVRFERRLFDDTALSTKPAVGLRAAVTLVPTAAPRLSAVFEFDWMKVRRSDDAALRKNGLVEGSVAQPEHRRRSLAAYLAYRFD
ncbi:MAG TPA: hypothetical protein VEC06_19050 [Paucimonas sp.]|nr:hypothetical protein [Paucimonas sp.]